MNSPHIIRKYAAEQGTAEEEAQKKGMKEKSREFAEKGSELYAWMLILTSANLKVLPGAKGK